MKDIARNTIVVERAQYDRAVALLRAEGAKVKMIDGALDPMGYSGANGSILTKAGIRAEIQVNTPEMIFAKENPAVARAILGDARYDALSGRIGVPGGQGHQFYEEWRVLSPSSKEANEIASASRSYYDLVRAKGLQ